jgi:hypothetical protein
MRHRGRSAPHNLNAPCLAPPPFVTFRFKNSSFSTIEATNKAELRLGCFVFCRELLLSILKRQYLHSVGLGLSSSFEPHSKFSAVFE